MICELIEPILRVVPCEPDTPHQDIEHETIGPIDIPGGAVFHVGVYEETLTVRRGRHTVPAKPRASLGGRHAGASRPLRAGTRTAGQVLRRRPARITEDIPFPSVMRALLEYFRLEEFGCRALRGRARAHVAGVGPRRRLRQSRGLEAVRRSGGAARDRAGHPRGARVRDGPGTRRPCPVPMQRRLPVHQSSGIPCHRSTDTPSAAIRSCACRSNVSHRAPNSSANPA